MELIKNSPKDCYPVVQFTTKIVLGKLEILLSVEDVVVIAQNHAQLIVRDLQSEVLTT